MKKMFKNYAVRFFALTIFSILSLNGCSGSTNHTAVPQSPKAITAFSFTTSANPALQTSLTGVINDTNATITLLGALVRSDVTALKATFTTTGAAVSVAGVLQESGVTANDFSTPLTYRVTAEDGTTKDYSVYVPHWRHPSTLADNINPSGSASAFEPQVAMDNNGNAIIVWDQSDGTYSRIYKSEYRGGTWSHPASLSEYINPDGGHASVAKVAMDDNGNAIIAWSGRNGSYEHVYKSEYRSGSWSHPANLTDCFGPDGQTSVITSIRIAMGGNDNAIIVWHQTDGTRSQIYKSEYRSGVWTHPANATDNISPDLYALDPQVAMDGSGNAIITWRGLDGSYDQIYKSEYRAGAWSHPTDAADNISPDNQNALHPKVAMDDNGNALIAWRQYDGSAYRIFKSEYRSGAWSHPTDLSDCIGPAGANVDDSVIPVAVAMGGSGDTIIVSRLSYGGEYRLFKSEYRAGNWTHPTSITDYFSPNGMSPAQPFVFMDDNGSALIVCSGSDGSDSQIFKSEYRSGSWTHPSGLSDNISPNSYPAATPHAAMDNSNNAVIVWTQGSTYEIFKSEYGLWQ